MIGRALEVNVHALTIATAERQRDRSVLVGFADQTAVDASRDTRKGLAWYVRDEQSKRVTAERRRSLRAAHSKERRC
jgi:hypothetical protein